MTLKEAYVMMQRASGIKVGDTVRVLRKAKDYEMGWNNTWITEMDKYVGSECQVLRIGEEGVRLKLSDLESFEFPFFVLEVVKKSPSSVEDFINEQTDICDEYKRFALEIVRWLKADIKGEEE